jgi:hypothetical protein
MTALMTRTRGGPDMARLWADAPAFAAMTLLMVLGLIPVGTAMVLDARQFAGDSPWLKPVKFHLALAIYLGSLAFFARHLPQDWRAGRVWRGFALLVAGCVVAEVAWLWAAAMVNTASHFNTEAPIFAAIYPVMGVLAVILTSAGVVMGVGIWRNRATGLAAPVHLSVALGLGLTFLLTVPVAGYLSGAGGHAVGQATRHLWLMGWARDAGDLRVAHFLSTHALHALPLAGLALAAALPPRAALTGVWLAAAAYVALVAGTFAQAMAGRPFLPFLG